jgi:hypothetical protein
MVRYNRFAEDSEHDWGGIHIGGYSFEWHIEYRTADGTGDRLIQPTPRKRFASLRSMPLTICSPRDNNQQNRCLERKVGLAALWIRLSF